MPLKEPPDWVREMVKARDDAGQSSTVGIGIDGSILIDGKQIWPRPPVAPGVAALGALVETIICDGLDNMEDAMDQDRLELRWKGPKGGEGFWFGELTRDGETRSGYSNDPSYVLDMLGMGHLKMDSYSALNCWSAEDVNKVQNYGGECRWQYAESIPMAALQIGWPDDKADFRNVDFSACQKQEYTYAVGDRHTVTGSPLSMNINVSGGVGRETAKQVAREIQRIVVSKEGGKPSNAKPALPALQTVAGDKYRGLGWCDE